MVTKNDVGMPYYISYYPDQSLILFGTTIYSSPSNTFIVISVW